MARVRAPVTRARAKRGRRFACAKCGGKWDYPVGIHLPGGAMSGPAWCPVKAKDVREVRRVANRRAR